MKRFTIAFLFLLLASSLQAENYLINGGQESKIKYQLIQEVKPSGKAAYLTLSYVVPETFQSLTYNQRIENFQLNFDPSPTTRDETKDERGNRIIRVTWNNLTKTVVAGMEFTAHNRTLLKTLKSTAPYPLRDLPSEFNDYLSATPQVQSAHPQIARQAKSLVSGVKTEFDAVQKILTWVIDHMRYVTPPKQYDALYSFSSGKGNCQNYSHLTAALMRASAIPVRIVNGVTLKEPYTAKTGAGEYTFRMGQGRHSWIEVYFPDLGWIPFDPQQTELFVSNRFIRVEIGVDNEETINDGMLKWRQSQGATGKPGFREIIDASFESDRVDLVMEKQNYGPRNMLVSPRMEAAFNPVITPPPPPPVKIDDSDLKRIRYTKRFVFGNLDFPQGVNFAFTHGPAVKDGDEFSMRRTFLVETAEYVTEKIRQFAQVSVLKEPVKLESISLAMQKYGGGGQLWIELRADQDQRPGGLIATSDLVDSDGLSSRPGYDWVDFHFRNTPLLSPGNYWIVLGFTGGPVINWYFTYGKTTGPVHGTRYKDVYETNWSGGLSYEFNYKLTGWTKQ